MASSLMRPSSPNSLRLRLGFRCRDSSSSFFLRVRFRPSNCRRVVASFAGESEGGGGAGWAWNVSDASLDAFAGWSDAGSGGEESEKKKGIRDVMGLALVGAILATGVAFTTLVFINKNLSGTKNRVDPSKEFITSYDTSTEDDQVSKDSDVILTEKDGMISNFREDNETGISKDLPLKYVSGDISEGRYDYMQKLESTLLRNVRSVGGSLSLNSVEMAKNADQNNFVQSLIKDCANFAQLCQTLVNKFH